MDKISRSDTRVVSKYKDGGGVRASERHVLVSSSVERKRWRRCPSQRTPCVGEQFRGKEKMAEVEGFEPSIGFPIHAFQACALGRYAKPPRG